MVVMVVAAAVVVAWQVSADLIERSGAEIAPIRSGVGSLAALVPGETGTMSLSDIRDRRLTNVPGTKGTDIVRVCTELGRNTMMPIGFILVIT